MNRISIFDGVRPRLLGLMILVMLPILIGSVFIASRAYQESLRDIENARSYVTNAFAARSEVWLRGAGQALLATYAGIRANTAGDLDCTDLPARIGAQRSDYAAILLILPGRDACTAIIDRNLDETEIATLAGARPSSNRHGGPAKNAQPDQSHFNAYMKNGQRYLVIRIAIPEANDILGSAMVLINGETLNATFDLGPLDDAIAGLVASDGEPIVTRGVQNSDRSWLPEKLPATKEYFRFSARTQSGEDFAYSALQIANSDLRIIMRFEGSMVEHAWQQYLFMTFMPLAAGVLLFFAYSVALQRDVVHWIEGIRKAARARIEVADTKVRAPDQSSMPRELRSVARDFNAMVDEGQARERNLQDTLEQNHFLMRELHHRVKNSLQVIQSYLSLSRREAGASRNAEIADTEARVLVLSVAYRLALTDGGMRPVPLRAIAEEVVSNLASSIRRDNQWISLEADIEAVIDVDRAIPFGLAIVEAVAASLRTPGCLSARVIVSESDNICSLEITADVPIALNKPLKRILQGLLLQLRAATGELDDPAKVLAWRFASLNT